MNSKIRHTGRLDRGSPCRADIRRNQAGQILLMTALALPVLLGFAALAIDAGYAFEMRKQLQATADSGAMAGAFAVDYDGSISQSALEAIVRTDAGRNGFVHGVSGVTVSVYHSPSTANGFDYDYSGDTSAVGVVITRPTSTFFINVLGSAFASLTIRAQAVASMGADSMTNVVVLEPTVAGIEAQGNGNISVGGNIYVNSTNATDAVDVQSASSSVRAPTGTIYVVGGTSGDVGPTVITGVPPIQDPLRNLAVPSVPVPVGSCAGAVCTPGRYLAGLKPNNQMLQAGIYYVYDDGAGVAVDFQGTVTGTDVTIYIESGGWQLMGPLDTATLTAPTAGTYAGILIFQSRTNATDSLVKQGTINFTGAVYMKTGNMNFQSGGGTGGGTPYLVWVVNNIHLQGGGTVLENDFSSLPGGSPLRRVSLAE